MNIRTASFRDLGRIEQLYRESLLSGDLATQLRPECPVPQATLMRVWNAVTKAVSSLMPMSDNGDVLYVAEDGQQGIVGFVQAEAIATAPKAWQILNLCVVSDGVGHFATSQLLTHLCSQGVEHGIHRFHARLPHDHPLVPLFTQWGFTPFATEEILYCDAVSPHTPQENVALSLRPAQRTDIPSMYLLYLRVTPPEVSNREGPTAHAWETSFAQGWIAKWDRDDVHHYVATESGLSAWAAIRQPSSVRPTVITMMCESSHDDVLDATLREVPTGPVACVLRHYDHDLIAAVRRRGFTSCGTQLLFVMDIAEKVHVVAPAAKKKRVLAHAGAAPTQSAVAVQIDERRAPSPHQ